MQELGLLGNTPTPTPLTRTHFPALPCHCYRDKEACGHGGPEDNVLPEDLLQEMLPKGRLPGRGLPSSPHKTWAPPPHLSASLAEETHRGPFSSPSPRSELPWGPLYRLPGPGGWDEQLRAGHRAQLLLGLIQTNPRCPMDTAAKAGHLGARREPASTLLNQLLAFPNLSGPICKMGTRIPGLGRPRNRCVRWHGSAGHRQPKEDCQVNLEEGRDTA